jgi:hypothetical protein
MLMLGQLSTLRPDLDRLVKRKGRHFHTYSANASPFMHARLHRCKVPLHIPGAANTTSSDDQHLHLDTPSVKIVGFRAIAAAPHQRSQYFSRPIVLLSLAFYQRFCQRLGYLLGPMDPLTAAKQLEKTQSPTYISRSATLPRRSLVLN